MKKLLSFLSFSIMAITVMSCGEKEETSKSDITIRLSHPSGAFTDDPIHAAALSIKEKLEDRSGGTIKVDIFPSSQLGGEERNVQDVQNGIIEMALITAGNMVSFSPSIGLYDFPYLFQSREESWEVIDALWDDLNALQVKESGTTTISWLEQGFRMMSNSKKPVKNLEDLQGLKIRIPNNKYVLAAFESWGISPIPLIWDEVFSALQQGVVDGQENPYVSMRVHKMYEIQKYITDLHYKIWLGVFIVNNEWLAGLSEEHRALILEVGKEITQENRVLIVETEKAVRKELEEEGMILTGVPTDEDIWREKAMSTWPKFYDTLPDVTILDEAMKLVGRQKP